MFQIPCPPCGLRDSSEFPAPGRGVTAAGSRTWTVAQWRSSAAHDLRPVGCRVSDGST
jgi:sarcosine oxidase delta subunit